MIYGNPGDQAVDDAAVAAFAEAYGQRVTSLPPVAIVIAAYNEAGAIGPVIEALPGQVCGLATATVVVADGCVDGTAKEAMTAGAMVCDVPVNRGQGAALRLGYRLARDGGATYIVTTDADGQYNPAEIERVLAPVVAGEADFVTGSRRLGSQETKDLIRKAGVLFFAGTLSMLTGQRISDTTFGLRAMRAEVTGAVRLEQPQYQASELLIGVITHGYKVAEVPATIHRRRIGESKKGQNPLYGLHLAARASARQADALGRVFVVREGPHRAGGFRGDDERLGPGIGRHERLFRDGRRGAAGRSGEEDVVEEQEPQHERAQVGHAVDQVHEEHALHAGQAQPGRRVVGELGGHPEDRDDHGRHDPERQGLLQQVRAALPLPRPPAEHVTHQGAGEPRDQAGPGGGQLQRPGADGEHDLRGGERRDGRDREASEPDAERGPGLAGERLAEPTGCQSHVCPRLASQPTRTERVYSTETAGRKSYPGKAARCDLRGACSASALVARYRPRAASRTTARKTHRNLTEGTSRSRSMKILVLGGDGYLGWPTALHLSEAGHEV